MTQEEKAAKAAALTLLLDGLSPSDLHDVLLEAGIYAPAVSSTQYVYRILDGVGTPERFREQLLVTVRKDVIQYTGTLLREVGALYAEGERAPGEAFFKRACGSSRGGRVTSLGYASRPTSTPTLGGNSTYATNARAETSMRWPSASSILGMTCC